MKRLRLTRLAALVLVLALLLALPAAALSVQQTRELLREHYVDIIPEQVLDQPTVKGILRALGDPYTEYLDPQQYTRFLAEMADDTIVGIGISVPAERDPGEGLLIWEVYDNSPAQAGGLLPGDVIVAVDHVDILDLELETAMELIRGKAGTRVQITYLRDGQRASVELTRDTVTIPSTTGQLLDGGVGYLDCTTWGEETVGHFRDLITAMDDDVGCWLIDLRDNGGGLAEAAAQTAGLFCGRQGIFYLRGRDSSGQSEDGYAYQFYTSRYNALTDKPVVILVDGGTASSSESFAAAMRDLDRAVVVGERTYGKGVAQGILDASAYPDYFPDGDCLKVTTARFYSSLGNTTDTIGVLPDFLITDGQSQQVAIGLATLFAEDPDSWREVTEHLQSQIIQDVDLPDLDQSPYAWSIAALASYDMLHGRDDGLFHGTDTLTRAELAQMLANLLHCPVPEDVDLYRDVPSDAWYAPAVAAISAQGLMEGIGGGYFSPGTTLTHQELITVVGRLGRWLNDDLDLPVRRSDAHTWDLQLLRDYADWAKSSAWLLSCYLENGNGRLINLLWDAPEDIEPNSPATREEAADAIYSLLTYLNLLP